MKTHNLKTWPKFFEETITEEKPFEYRAFDRDFEAGDLLILDEYDPEAKRFTGSRATVTVLKIWGDLPGLPPGFVIMSIKLISFGVCKHESNR